RRCELKTAALFECACVIGKQREPEMEAALTAYGRAIGLAFQLLDDVLDVVGPVERTGKARGTDLLDGTVTLPFILARDRDPGLTELELRALDPAGAEEVCDRIAATGAPERVRQEARSNVAAAKRRLRQSGLEERDLRMLDLV